VPAQREGYSRLIKRFHSPVPGHRQVADSPVN
jgi:hypothetical protein